MKFEEELCRVIGVDAPYWTVEVASLITNKMYKAPVKPSFYDSNSGAVMIYMPTLGSMGKLHKTNGIFTFSPEMPASNTNAPAIRNVPVIQPGDFYIRGPSGSSIRIEQADSIMISVGMGLASRTFSGASDTISDICRRYTLSTDGGLIDFGPTLPMVDMPEVPTKLFIGLRESLNSSIIPDLIIEGGATSQKNVIALLTHLASATAFLLKKSGELEVLIKNISIGLNPDTLVKSSFLREIYPYHTHPDKGEPPTNADPTMGDSLLYNTKILKSS